MNAGLSDSEATQLTSSAQTQAYQFDAAAEAIGLKMNQEPFHDIRVRIAMQKAINLEEVATAYYGYDELTLPGLWDPALTSWSTVGTWDDELMDEYTYDPEGAKQLLAEAGYPDGFSFTVAIDAMANPEIFELAKGYFAEVGIDMEITILSDMSEGRQVQLSLIHIYHRELRLHRQRRHPLRHSRRRGQPCHGAQHPGHQPEPRHALAGLFYLAARGAWVQQTGAADGQRQRDL